MPKILLISACFADIFLGCVASFCNVYWLGNKLQIFDGSCLCKMIEDFGLNVPRCIAPFLESGIAIAWNNATFLIWRGTLQVLHNYGLFKLWIFLLAKKKLWIFSWWKWNTSIDKISNSFNYHKLNFDNTCIMVKKIKKLLHVNENL